MHQNHKWIAVFCAAVIVAGSGMTPVQAAEAKETTIVLDCLQYQKYDDAGIVELVLPEAVQCTFQVEQYAQERETYLFYEITGKTKTPTRYQMPLEAGEYHITLSVPTAWNSAAVFTYQADITIENPDFVLSPDACFQYTYTIDTVAESLDSLPAAEAPVFTEQADGRHCETAVTFLQMPVLLGDANQDGAIQVEDAICILQYYAQKSAGLDALLGDSPEAHASIFRQVDMNGDAAISVEDASAVLQYYAMQSAGLV